MSDTRFPTALQIMITVAVNGSAGVRTTSPMLAASLDTNASFVRRIVGALSRSGLVVSTDGSRGGISLARKASNISLYDIHRSILPEQRSWAAREGLHQEDAVSRHIAAVSDALGDQADRAVAEVLRNATLQQCIDQIDQLENRRAIETT